MSAIALDIEVSVDSEKELIADENVSGGARGRNFIAKKK
jgi:hypothetical protein